MPFRPMPAVAMLTLIGLRPCTAVEARQLSVIAFPPVPVVEMVANSQLDPNEGVDMAFCANNESNAPIANVTGTLLNADGVVQSSGARSFGTIEPNSTTCELFRFRAIGACGGAVRANIRLDPGGVVSTIPLPLGAGGLVESFDALSVGQLPLNVSTSASGVSPFAVSSAAADTAPNSIFAPNPGNASDSHLTTRPIRLPPGPATLSFRHSFDTELGWDGGVLEISTDGSAFQDILVAGGAFTTGGYSASLGAGANVLAGRSAWTGNSNGFVTTTVLLPSAATSREVRVRWRFGTDGSIARTGWFIDSIATSNVGCASVPTDAPGLFRSSVRGNLVTFTWLPPFHVAPTGYLLDVSLDDGATFAFTIPLGPQPSFSATGPDVVAWTRVRSVLANGDLSTPSNLSRAGIGAAGPPPSAVNLQTVVNGTTVGLAWSLVEGGGTAVRTVLRVGSTPGAADLGVVTLPPGAITFQSSNVPGGTYHLSVRQEGPVLVGAGAGPAAPLTVPGTCTPPKAPTLLTATASARVVTVTWDLAGTGSAPTSWTLEAGSSSNLSNLAVLPLGTRSISAPVPPGTYFLRVSAANPCGASPKSAEISITVP
jgi:hypothetical protein